MKAYIEVINMNVNDVVVTSGEAGGNTCPIQGVAGSGRE